MVANFPDGEFEERLEGLRRRMTDHELDAVVVSNHQNINYFAGLSSILAGIPGGYGLVRPQIAILPRASEPTLLVQTAERGNAEANSWIDDVRCWESLPFDAEVLVTALRDKGLHNARIGMEFSREFHLSIPYLAFEEARRSLHAAEFIDAADLIWDLRMVKSHREIDLLRQAALITAKALLTNLPSVKEGMTERDVARQIARSLLDEGADKFNYVSAISGDGHYSRFCQHPTDRVVRSHEMLWSDLSAVYRGYCSDMSSFTFVDGSDSEQQRLEDLARWVHLKTVDYIKPGVAASDVMKFVGRCFQDAGFDWDFKIGRCGHGIGLELAEQPSLDPNSDVILKPGMTLALEPAILHHRGVFDMEEDLVVTHEGCEVLAPLWRR